MEEKVIPMRAIDIRYRELLPKSYARRDINLNGTFQGYLGQKGSSCGTQINCHSCIHQHCIIVSEPGHIFPILSELLGHISQVNTSIGLQRE